MAQMPIELVSSRAQPFAAASPAVFAAKPKVASPHGGYLHETSGISGGLLRPGAVDQELFKAHLAAAAKDGVLVPQATVRMPAPSGVPSLSPAQLAALGAVEEPAKGELVIDIPAPNPVDPGQGGRQPPPGQPGGIAGGTGSPATPLVPAAPAPDSTAPAATEAAPNAALPTAAPATAPAPRASAERGPIPGAHRGADGVWELTRLPDKDERDMMVGQKWRVVESEESRKLFLGPDGEFGWDDFVDLINPLQHIPLVNIAYRAITGDEIYGAARMVDVAMGPLAGVSTALDLAFLDVTGESMASNAVAALFGADEAPAGDVRVNTASASPVQTASVIRLGSNK